MLSCFFSALLALPALAESTSVELEAPDGARLAATYTSAPEPGPGVLLLHMCNSDRSAWTDLAGMLAARGIHSLALDYRGFGDSSGEQRREDRGQLWPGDIDNAFEYLRSRPGVDGTHVGAAGGSCGVNQAVQLARRHPGEVQTLVLLAGGTDDDSEAFLAENPWLPVLASASRDDGRAVEGLRWSLGFSSYPGNRFLEYQHGGHGTEMFAVHADLEPAMAKWFEQHLVRRPVKMPADVAARPGPSGLLMAELAAPDVMDRLAARLRAAKARGEDLPRPLETAINTEGYRRINAGETSQAIEILAFNVETFPRSANALDSLGDAYLADGQPEKAAALARRTIAAIAADSGLGEDFANALRESAEGKLEPGRPQSN